jgi:hypothetical protein
MLGIVLPELGHQCAIQALDKAIVHTNCILLLHSKKMLSVHHPVIIFNDAGSDRLAISTRQHLMYVLKNCMWLVTVARAELDKDGCCDLLEAKM